jgi:hypothetical protein
MKQRGGFISNSSSSSFIIAVPKDGKLTISIEVNLEDVLKHRFSTKEQLEEYIEEDYMYGEQTLEELLEEEPWVAEWYHKAIEQLALGKEVIEVRGSSEGDSALESFIYEGGLTKESLPEGCVMIRDEQ